MIKIIIADDEESIRKGLISLHWEKIDVKVVGSACDGYEVVELLKKQRADILLTDIRMPGMSGIVLSRQILKLYPDLKVIFLTGHEEFGYAQEAVRLGIFDYILKPITPKDIISCVGRAKEKIIEMQEKREEICLVQRELEHHNSLGQVNQILASVPETDQDELIEVILKYLGEHYDKNVTLSVLAEITHFNADYLSRYIKQKTGQNFLSILTGIRISHASKLLSETELMNYEVAEKVGIQDERYFSQVFKKKYGITPSQYRRARRKDSSAVNFR